MKEENLAVVESGQPKMEVKRVSSLDELQAAVDVPVMVSFPLRGKLHEVTVRRLRPEEEARLTVILSEARPPQKQVIDERGNPRMEFDHSDPDYVKKARELEIVVRALALWWCVDLFRQSKDAPPLEGKVDDRAKIVEFVQKKLTEAALEAMYRAARGDIESLRPGDSLEERISFI